MKALIIDDEPMPAKHLREMIKQHCFEISEIEIIQSPKKAMTYLEENKFDLLFLDVEMPEMSGIEFLKQINLPLSTSVIFTTAYSEYALDAFKANATHYIVKPVEAQELITALRKVLLKNNSFTKNDKEDSNQGKSISVFDGEEYTIVKTDDIIRLQADGSYTKFILKNGEILASKRMGFFEDKLNSINFVRCHNSHLINLKEVSKLSKGKGGYLIMSNSDTIPISSSKKIFIEEMLGL